MIAIKAITRGPGATGLRVSLYYTDPKDGNYAISMLLRQRDGSSAANVEFMSGEFGILFFLQALSIVHPPPARQGLALKMRGQKGGG